MAAGNFTFYNNGKLVSFTSPLASNDIAVVLLTSSYTPDVASHTTYGDVSGNEITDADYAQQALPNTSYSESSGDVTYDSDNVSFGSDVSIEAKYAVFVLGTAGSLGTGDSLIGYVDLNTDGTSATVSSTNSEFSVNTPSGLFTAS